MKLIRPFYSTPRVRSGAKSDRLLARAMCRDFEHMEGDYKIVTHIDFIVKVTILHEMVHWGDLRDAVEQPDVLYEDPSGRERKIDVGHEFELEA